MASRTDTPFCPGFCGRVPENNSFGWSECQPCPWGSRTHGDAQCFECDSPISSYDWCYLIFMAIVPMLVNCLFVHLHSIKKPTRLDEFLEVFCCFSESICAAFSSLLFFPPRGYLSLYGCYKSGLKEWYPALYNPVIGHIKQIKCSYEVVFPLYSLPFVYFLFLLLFMLILRCLFYSYVVKDHDPRPFYYGLLSLPKVAVIHGLFAGVIYLTFPYLLIMFSVCSNAFHLAMEGKAPVREILRRLYRSPLQLVLLCVNMILLAFAIIALTAASNSSYGLFFLFLVPIPALFYIATIGLSHPSVLNDV